MSGVVKPPHSPLPHPSIITHTTQPSLTGPPPPPHTHTFPSLHTPQSHHSLVPPSPPHTHLSIITHTTQPSLTGPPSPNLSIITHTPHSHLSLVFHQSLHHYAYSKTATTHTSHTTIQPKTNPTFPPVYTWRVGLLMVTAHTTSPWFSVLIWRACRGIPGPMSASGGKGTGCICPSPLTWNE